MSSIHSKLGAALLLTFVAMNGVSAQSASEIIEKARAEAKEFNEFKLALEDPDQSVRLAVFEQMLKQPAAPLRMMAIQAGLTSSDDIMRSRALVAQILDMDHLVIHLKVNEKANSKSQEATKKLLLRDGDVWRLSIRQKNPDDNTFSIGVGEYSGKVNGLQVSLLRGPSGMHFQLDDNNRLVGRYTSPNGPIDAVVTMELF